MMLSVTPGENLAAAAAGRAKTSGRSSPLRLDPRFSLFATMDDYRDSSYTNGKIVPFRFRCARCSGGRQVQVVPLCGPVRAALRPVAPAYELCESGRLPQDLSDQLAQLPSTPYHHANLLAVRRCRQLVRRAGAPGQADNLLRRLLQFAQPGPPQIRAQGSVATSFT
jgi:hypothetical protein